MRCAEPSQTRRFSHRNLYIFSSRFGGLWCASAVVLALISIQTSSTTPLLLAYLMGGLMLLGLFLTHQNLAGLELRTLKQPIAFAGERGTICLGPARPESAHGSGLFAVSSAGSDDVRPATAKRRAREGTTTRQQR